MAHAPSLSLVAHVVDERYRVQAHLADGGMASVYIAVDPEAVRIVQEHDLTAEVVDLESAHLFSSWATRPLRVFLKEDVGYERLGVPAEQMLETVGAIQQLPNLTLGGVFSHAKLEGLSPRSPVPGEAASSPFVQWQFDRLRAALAQVEAAGIDLPVAMVASSSVVSQAPEAGPGQGRPGGRRGAHRRRAGRRADHRGRRHGSSAHGARDGLPRFLPRPQRPSRLARGLTGARRKRLSRHTRSARTRGWNRPGP